MNTKKVLNALNEEVKNPNKKRVELTDEELKQVCGGNWIDQDGRVIQMGVSSKKTCLNCGHPLMCNKYLDTGEEFDHHCVWCG